MSNLEISLMENSQQEKSRGIIRVGKLNWDPNQKQDTYDKVPGYTPVIIKSYSPGSSLGASLSPFHLKNEHGQIMENVWQV
jgi:hypothetical protein